MDETIDRLLERAAALKRDGRDVLACLLVKARGSTPASAGALMLVDDEAGTYGTIGGGCVEAEVRRTALSSMRRERRNVLRLKLDHDYGWDDGLICGGTVDVAVGELPGPDVLDRICEDIRGGRAASLTVDCSERQFTLMRPARPKLLIAGAGHVGQALARLATDLEFDVTVVDDRADLLAQQVVPPARALAGTCIATIVREFPIDENTYCVVVTRGHRHDEQALEAALGRGAAYLGMIGSRRKVKLIMDDLRARGACDEELQRVHAPIGLNIGASTVPEIAVSIAAELVRERRSRPASLPRVVESSVIRREAAAAAR